MSYIPYNFLQNLNSLSPDSSPVMTQQDLEAELGVWENVQFTFDIPQGIGIYDDEASSFGINKIAQQSSTEEVRELSHEDESPVTFEALSQYLDYELPEKHDSSRQSQAQILPSTTNGNITVSQLQHINSLPAFLLAPAVNITQTPLNNRIAPAPSSVPITSTIANMSNIASPKVTSFLGNKPVLIQPSIMPALQTAVPNSTLSNPVSLKVGTKRLQSTTEQSTLPSASENNSQDGSITEEDQELLIKAAAEEDKRRRNTAASARFRIKKKQREQTLERTAREMTQKAEALEGRVRELEMEVKWLRGLIVEKDSRLLDVADGKKVWLEVKDESSEAKEAKKVKV